MAATFTGKVFGSVVATRKDEKLQGRKLLVIQPVNADGGGAGKPMIAVDLIGAGAGETVLLCRSGDAARAAGMAPVDAAIIGIVDPAGAPRQVPQVDLQSLGFHAERKES